MTDESNESARFKRVQALYRAALAMTEEERRDFLADACPGDPELRDEVECLLADETRSTIQDLADQVGRAVRPGGGGRTPQPGERIGQYKLLRAVGEGGMGLVFEAEQEQPIHRKVAFKVIKPGMDSKQVLARFDTEKEALALMNHPNIAKVLDAGTSENGLPFFVMEFVEGVSITEYCDRHNVPTDERLGLFVDVCAAVHHAHQKGVIHRDLKPSNILVSVRGGQPSVKIIDFGVAKALERRLTEMTIFTEFGQMIGTPEYMSPEQAEMSSLDIDTRTDVYSLGVLLYQLLIGALPFEATELRRRGYDEIRRIIREKEPHKPSTRLESLGDVSSEIAVHRRTELSTLMRRIRGDLDWITMKALEKDRTRRYDSAAAMADDIRRHLSDEPVLAGPPQLSYRAGKFVRRHRIGVSVAAIVVLALAAGAVLASVGMVRAERSEQVARFEAETSQEVIEFLIGLFEVSDPGEARGNSVTAREVLDGGVESIRMELLDRPALRGRLLEVMGRVYRSLGLYDDAAPLLDGSVKDLRRAHGDSSVEVAGSLNTLGGLLVLAGRAEEAAPFIEEALRIHEQAIDADDAETGRTLSNLGNVYRKTGRMEEAQATYERALALREAALGPHDPDVARTLNNLGYLHQTLKDFEPARRYFERALSIRERAFGAGHPDVARTLANLANLERRAGNLERCRPLLERALTIQETVLGPDHRDVAMTLNNLALVALLEKRGDEAEPLCRRALEIRESLFGPDHATTRKSVKLMVAILEDSGRGDEAASYQTRLESRADHGS